jgi:hypothetical protein
MMCVVGRECGNCKARISAVELAHPREQARAPFGMLVCWRAEQLMPDGRVWTSSALLVSRSFALA